MAADVESLAGTDCGCLTHRACRCAKTSHLVLLKVSPDPQCPNRLESNLRQQHTTTRLWHFTGQACRNTKGLYGWTAFHAIVQGHEFEEIVDGLQSFRIFPWGNDPQFPWPRLVHPRPQHGKDSRWHWMACAMSPNSTDRTCKMLGFYGPRFLNHSIQEEFNIGYFNPFLSGQIGRHRSGHLVSTSKIVFPCVPRWMFSYDTAWLLVEWFWMSEMDCQSLRMGCHTAFLPCVVTVVTQSHGTHPLAAWLNRRVYPPPSGIVSGGPNENGQCMECSRDE